MSRGLVATCALYDPKCRETRYHPAFALVGLRSTERGAVVQSAKELVEFARHHGYRLDELVEIIEDVG